MGVVNIVNAFLMKHVILPFNEKLAKRFAAWKICALVGIINVLKIVTILTKF